MHDPIKGSWMQSQGELMQILADIGTMRKSIVREASNRQQELDESMRSMRNKALTEIITAGYEAKESIKEVTDNISENARNLLEIFDRYL